jgi:N-acetylmuramoyl-L-alanine amidase
VILLPLLAAAAMPAKPPITHNPIPFGARRKAEMRHYAQRHYGLDTFELRDPKVIVIHYTDNDSFDATFNTFAPDTPDPELHELPNVCSHFVIDQSGTIHQLVPLGLMCRHTVGLNWTAIGIEHVGRSDGQVLGNHQQLQASLDLVRWLQGRYGIETKNVIGHNESLSSPFHRERVKSLQSQTHGDFVKRDMDRYRAKLRKLGG